MELMDKVIPIELKKSHSLTEWPIMSRKGASIYDVRSVLGEGGPQKADKRNEVEWIMYRADGVDGPQEMERK